MYTNEMTDVRNKQRQRQRPASATSTTTPSSFTDRTKPLSPPYQRHWTEEEAATSPAVEFGRSKQQQRHPPISDTQQRVRYHTSQSSTNVGPVNVVPNPSGHGRRRKQDGAPPGSLPLEPLAKSAGVGQWRERQPVQAFYEPDQTWYDARVVKIVPRRVTKRKKAKGEQGELTVVVRFEDGFAGEHYVDHVRERSIYPLNLGRSVESNAHGRKRYPGTKGIPLDSDGKTPLQSLTPDVLSRLHTPGEKRNFPFKYSIPPSPTHGKRRSVTGSIQPFTARVSMDSDDVIADRILVKSFRDYYYGPKDVVEASIVDGFKTSVNVAREIQRKRLSKGPRPRSALPAGRRVPPSWMKRHRRRNIPINNTLTSSTLTSKSKRKSKKKFTWRDYVWCHMHNWHFDGTGPGTTTKKQFQTLFRAKIRNTKRREKLVRDIETISSFRIDIDNLDQMLKALSERTITRAEAKDRAGVIIDNAINGCGRGPAPVSALRALRVVGSEQAKHSIELRDILTTRLFEAIDEDWGPGDTSGDLGPKLTWNMSHPGVDVLLHQDKIRTSPKGTVTTRKGILPGLLKDVSSTGKALGEKLTGTKLILRSKQIVKTVTTAAKLDKLQIQRWATRTTSLTPPQYIPPNTSILQLTGSRFGTSVAADVLSDALFQSLPCLIKLDLSRTSLDSRALEGLARGLVAPAPKQKSGQELAAILPVGSKIVPTFASPHLEILILDSNFALRGRPTSKQKRKELLKAMGEDPDESKVPDFEEALLGIEALAQAIRKHRKLHTVSLRKNALGKDGSRRFLRLLLDDNVYIGSQKATQTLHSLCLASSGCSNKGFAAMRALTLTDPTTSIRAVLKDLDVSHNGIDQAGIHTFFEPPQNDLDRKRSLNTLILRQNNLTLESIQTIVAAIKSKAWYGLSTLDLSLCDLGDLGAGMMANVLRKNRTLTCLNVSSCNLTDNGTRFRGVLDLISSVQVDNRTLKHLDLRSNTLVKRRLGRFDDDDECGWALVKLIDMNRQLQTLNIKGNAFNMKVRYALKKAINKAPLANLDYEKKIAFWMCKQTRLGANSPANVLWYGMLAYITKFLAKRRDCGEICF